jgi:hypothetical protein
MALPSTLFVLGDKHGLLPGRPFVDRAEAVEHMAACDPTGQFSFEIGEYELKPKALQPDLSFCEGEERS